MEKQKFLSKTTAKTLNYWLQSDGTFLGCYSKSNLPDFPSNTTEAAMIINTENEHWVAIVLTDTECFYFDPLANENIETEIFQHKNYYFW